LEALKQYKIGFTGLANGRHHFPFDIGPAFFDCFDHSEIERASVHLDLNLDKESNMLVFDFVFSGWIELVCGRCLGCYHEPVDHQQRIYVKFGDDFKEQSEDVLVIPHTESHFDTAQYVFEFLHLMLPLRRVHPDDEAGASGCDQVMLKRVKEHTPGHRRADSAGPNRESPFEALKSLRFDKDN